MTPEIQPRTVPPRPQATGRGGRVLLPALASVAVRRRGYWAGWAGLVTTLGLAGVTVALLVGWILLWVFRPEGPSIALLVLGTLAFAAIITALVTLVLRLRIATRLHQTEATFLAATSHNLRTPVAGIRAAAQTLDHPDLDDERRQKLHSAIVGETDRLSRSLDNLLETSRLEVERAIRQDELVEINQLIEEAVASPSFVAELKGGHVHVEKGEEFFVQGDHVRLCLALENLLDNAVKYSDGAPDIQVCTGRLARDSNWLLIQIHDQGIGFEAADARHFFKRFKRGDTGRSGIGLGLSLARAIAHGHGGEVELHSDGLGKGTIAEMWLPLAQKDGETRG